MKYCNAADLAEWLGRGLAARAVGQFLPEPTARTPRVISILDRLRHAATVVVTQSKSPRQVISASVG